MTYTRKSMFDRVLAVMLSILMVIALLPVSVIGVAAEANSTYATVSTYTGGTITGNGTANVEVLVENTTLAWVEGNALRAEGWWVGIDVVAPAEFSADATYKIKTNPTAEYGDAKSFAEMKDGENDIQLWFPVSAESLKKFASEDRNLTMTYAFDWDANEEYEQTIVFSVVPSEKIVLTKNGEQVYPEIVNYGTVSTYTGGTIKDNGTANVEVLVEETTLQWVEANALRAEGWWVGIDVVAPDDYSADATYKVKTNPTAEYGAAKNFAEMKDGEKDIQLWFPVSATSLEKFASEGRNLTMTYAFDWNADGEYEQTVVFSVAPSEKIVLMKGEDQVYPVLKSTVTVSQNEGGTVSLNGDTTGTLVVENGTTVNVVVEAKTGYQISKVTINGNETVVDAKSFDSTIENIAADATVAVTYVKLYTVTVSGNDKGTVSTTPEGQGGSVTVVDGSKVTVTATPENGYRVSGVMINGVAQTVTGANDSGYTVELTADDEYSVEVTFAPNIYKVEKESAENGDFEIKNPSVEHGGSTNVVITPDAGYTVDTFKVEGATVSNIVKDATGIWFTVSDIKSDVKVVVTFKATAKANTADVSKDTENVSLRKNETLFVVKDGAVITFKTEKTGMRMFGDLGLIAGDATTKTITIPGDTTITSIELYYQADGELYADWHVVEMNAITVAEDVEAPTLSLVPSAPATNGYYNTDVTLNVSIEDKNYYSGISKVEYWITYNDVDGTVAELKGFTAGDATYTDTITVSSAIYNSDKIKVTLKVTDLAGNEDEITYDLKINATAPVHQLNMTGDQNVNALEGYYETNRVLTITIKDRQGTFSPKAVADGLVIKKNGVAITVNEADITWKHSTDGETHIGEYTFKDEAKYEWSFSYANSVGTPGVLDAQLSDSDIYSFVIDHTAPGSLEITYEPTFVDTLLENITFGFYKAPVKVTIKATDNVAGIEKFVYSYTVQDGASVTNSGLADGVILSDAFATNDGKTATATFEIPAQFRGKVSFSAMDKSGQISELKTDDKVVVVDNVAPGIVVEYTGPNASYDKYYNGDRTVTIEITEANFFAQDLEDGLLVITVGKTLNDGTSTITNVKPVFTKNGDVYTASIVFDENADYTFDIKYTDRSGNVYDDYIADEFTIDKIAPVIDIEFDNNSALNTNQYKADRTATITVTEHNFIAADVVAVVTENGVTNNYYTEYLKDDANWTHNGDVHTAEITFATDAHITFDIDAKDLAGNPSEDMDPIEFTLDKTKPTNLKITYEPTFIDSLLENITFGFYKAPVKVTIEATDDTSGIDYFTYTYAVQQGTSATNVGQTDIVIGHADFDSNDGKTATASFTIPAQFRGFVSFVVTDMAGNSEDIYDEKCVVVDEVAPGITVEYDKVDAKNGKYFDGDREATIKITESNFFAADMTDLVPGTTEEYLVITIGKTLNDGSYTLSKVRPDFVKDGDVYTAKIKFTENADYTFDIKYTDRAGNVYDSYEMDEFTIDKIDPVLSISYDNNAVANGKYYKADRTATITVVEHNFRASDIDFDIVAKDVTGTKTVDLSAKGYETYLQNQDNWTRDGDTWTAQIVLDIEGNYSIDMKYADLAARSEVTAIDEDFCIDKSKPENLKISYEPTFVGTLLETITFGFYKAPVKVTIEATDEYAGVDYFTYTYAVQDGASSTNVGKSNVVVESSAITYDGNKASYSFEIPAQFRGNVSFTAMDRAGNSDGIADENVVVVDNVAPGVNVVYDNNNVKYGKYYSADRTATITITEANFFAADLDDEFLVITVGKTLNDGTETVTKMKPEFTKNGDVYTATIEFNENADYTFDIKYTDRSGNVYDDYVMDEFTIDKIKPIINVSYNNNTCNNGDQFKADRKATITVTEHNFIAEDVIATITANGTAVDSYTTYLKNDANWTHVGDVHTAVIEFTTEAHYTFDIECSDLAGNTNVEPVDYGTSVAPERFTLDKSAPTDLTITINDASVLGTTSVAFDKFYGGSVTVKLGANCDISGLESLKYQKVTAVTEYDVNGTWLAYDAENGIVVNPSEKFIIYFRAEDRAGNVSIVNSTGIVVDDKKPTGETKAPEIDILPVAPNVHGYYNGDVIVNLKVVDPKHTGADASENGYYSGLNKITYKIYTTDTDAVEEGVLLDLTNKTEGAEFDTDNLVKAWTGKINITASKFNSNNVIVVITAVDNAGNERTSTTVAGDIKIDITPSKIEVTYDNNEGDTSFAESTYFKADRTATIVVTERNFNPELFKLEITNTDGYIPEIGEWQTVTAAGNGDESTHTAKVIFNKDGDYTMAVSCVDKALNTNVDPDPKDSLAPWAFTVDKTAPVVSVVYDNNDVLNGNYYKAQRIATITVTEHNFETSRIKIALKATDDGKDATLPTVSNWTSNGDVHTATITYAADSLYVFDFDYNDKAGNATADIAEQTFYVDKTNPVLTIEKIVDESANNDEGDIGFVMTATDTNFDVFTPVLTAVVKKGDTFETKQLEIGQITDIKNGKVFTVTNIEADGIYRITCTIVDKAGNAYSEVTLEKADGTKYVEKRAGEDTLVTFSVNRDGSTFEVDENTVGVVEQYYVQNVENDVVIVEINADPLKEYTVTLNGKALEKDKDYTVTEEGGNGAWMKYTYKVNKDLFADEGEYKLVVSSKDKADNDAFSDVKEAAVEFVVDRTAPVVTVSGIANDGRYQTDKQTVTLIPTDDGGALKTLIVNMVDEDGKVIKEVLNLTGEALMTELEANGGKITFEIAEGLYQNVQIICTDCATGETEETNTHDTTIKNVSVSSSVFMIFWANKPLRWGTIGGVSAAAIALAVFIILKKKKRKTA